ncbi:MAG: HAD-IC family P-type ATPase, partial [Desulfitobacteriaceae bacterium]|nr:HAD-IC family P-type ATPase [Desulfitobacteriaceae bacterium]
RQVYLAGGRRFAISGEGYNGEGEITDSEGTKITDQEREHLKNLSQLAILANEGDLKRENGEWVHYGDAMDVAFLAMGYKLGLVPDEVKSAGQLVGSIPYEPVRKFAAAFYEKNGITQIAAKGAVETILDLCNRMQNPDGVVELEREEIDKQAEAMAANGYRVLAVAGAEYPELEQRELYEDDDLPRLVFHGLVGFIDPLRPEAFAAVNKCKEAGIKVIMITGDHPGTALAISRELGLVGQDEAVVTGQQLSEAGSSDSPAYMKLVSSTHVFARVSPTQKMEIVEVLINQGEYVAVTGDGVNDAPAMRRANIGVAMGSGTEVAKEISSMIVTDDNFASIVAGVEEGRFAYDNVRKVTYMLISTGAAEVTLVLASILFGLPLPLLAVQILWLNLVTNGIQDIAMAFEAGEPGAMKRKPRKPNEKIFNSQMISQTLVSGLTIGLISFSFWYFLLEVQLMDEFQARNINLLLMVLMQNVHSFNCRSEFVSVFKIPISRNYFLVFAILAAQGLHILCMHLPFMQQILRLTPITLIDWFEVFILALPILLVMEIYKKINARFLEKKAMAQ